MKSAGYVAILLPNPPPTSGAITRSLSSGTPVTTEQQEAKDVRILRRVPQRQLAGCAAPLRERRARLHRVRDEPLLDDALLDDDFGVRERGVDVAACDRPVEGLVVRHLGMKLRRP